MHSGSFSGFSPRRVVALFLYTNLMDSISSHANLHFDNISALYFGDPTCLFPGSREISHHFARIKEVKRIKTLKYILFALTVSPGQLNKLFSYS